MMHIKLYFKCLTNFVAVTQFNENVDLVRTRQNFKHPQQRAEVCSVESIVGDQEFDVHSCFIVTYRYTFYNNQSVNM